MRIALNNQPEMKTLAILRKLVNNPWVGILISISFIIPCLYRVLDDITIMRKEYIVLLIAFPIYIKSLKRIFDDILDPTDDFTD